MKQAMAWAMAAMVATAVGAQEPDMEEMMKMLGNMAEAQKSAAPAAMISGKALKDALPQELPGFERVEAGSEKQSVFGLTTVIATGVYESGAKSIRIELTDTGGMGGLGGLAALGLANNEVDKETRTGFERTTTYQEFKALESFDKVSQDGEIQIFVGARIGVKINGSGQESFEDLSAAVKALDLKALSELKPETPAP